jgi:hypothetical protein
VPLECFINYANCGIRQNDAYAIWCISFDDESNCPYRKLLGEPFLEMWYQSIITFIIQLSTISKISISSNDQPKKL